MYQKRREQLLDSLKGAGSAALLCSSTSVFYYSGFNGDDSWLLVTADGVFLLTDGRYLVQAQRECPEVQCLCRSSESLADLVAQTVEKMQVKALMFEESCLSAADYLELVGRLPNLPLTAAQKLLRAPRECKDGQEVACIKRAAQIADNALDSILKHIQAGVTEAEIARRLEYAMLELGAEGCSFTTIAAAGPNGALPHAHSSGRVLLEGDLLVLDFGAKYHGYCSDMTRTFGIGRLDAQKREIYDLVWQAQRAGLAAVRAGISGATAHQVAQQVFAAAGMEQYFVHSLGHSVGLDIHEAPNLSPRECALLQVGNVVTVEPGLYLPEVCGVRIEDTVLVTAEGCEILTGFPKELQIL